MLKFNKGNSFSLIGGILVFLATFANIASLNETSFALVNAQVLGIYHLLPMLGITGIVTAGLAIQGKMNIKLSSLIIGSLVLVISIWYVNMGIDALNGIAKIQADMEGGFNSGFFTGKHVDTSSLPKAHAGFGALLYIVGAALLLVAGLVTKSSVATHPSSSESTINP